LSSGEIKIRLVVEEVREVAALGILLSRLEGEGEYFVLGDFGSGRPGRYSYLGFGPREVIVFDQGEKGSPWEKLEEACGKYQWDMAVELPVPFGGGWVGYLSYDLGRYIERLPDGVVHDVGVPLFRFGFYDKVLAWDGQKELGYLLVWEYPGQQSSVQERLAKLRQLTQASGKEKETIKWEHKLDVKPIPSTEELVRLMKGNIEADDYRAKVNRAVEYIKAGDIFEVNLSQRFSCPYGGIPAVLYEYLTRNNPAGYAGLLKAGDHAVVSASPELFLSRRGKKIVTRPIKGTAPRGANEQENQKNRQWLLESDKDRAELNMIIDLERNDLGRVCKYGTVKVLAEREIEEHPTVLHTVATIAGELQDNTTNGDILRATFPGGSITGAPKIRAMEIIDELEPTARCIYTGSIGWIGVNGDMDLNIAIRTIILADKTAYLQAGGAVVADSDPQKEYEETLAKAAALLKALYVTNPQSF